MSRDVREDQHGTATGYVYGCRCKPCRDARFVYENENHVSETVVEAAMQAIRLEADLDDLCTSSSGRLAELIGVSQPTANLAIRKLAEQGRVRIGGVTGRGSARKIYVVDGAS